MRLIGYDLPLLGVTTLLLLILLVGVIVRSYLGHRVYSIGDRILARLPLIRPIYSAAKQLLEAIAGPSMDAFKDVALIEYPRKGCWSLGFCRPADSAGDRRGLPAPVRSCLFRRHQLRSPAWP